jgi:hypothetical protein
MLTSILYSVIFIAEYPGQGRAICSETPQMPQDVRVSDLSFLRNSTPLSRYAECGRIYEADLLNLPYTRERQLGDRL